LGGAEFENGVGAVLHCLPAHFAHLARAHRAVDRHPVDPPGLGFHQPEILLLVAAHQIVIGAIGDPVRLRILDVIVPGGDIEALVQREMIEPVVPEHGVGGDELARIGERPDRVAWFIT
jgi:hypothetical protein